MPLEYHISTSAYEHTQENFTDTWTSQKIIWSLINPLPPEKMNRKSFSVQYHWVTVESPKDVLI